jgi:hypothetical protein
VSCIFCGGELQDNLRNLWETWPSSNRTLDFRLLFVEVPSVASFRVNMQGALASGCPASVWCWRSQFVYACCLLFAY